MTTTQDRQFAATNAALHSQKIVSLLLRAHGLSKTLELAILAAAERHEQMKDSVKFSEFITAIEQANDAVHEALDAAWMR